MSRPALPYREISPTGRIWFEASRVSGGYRLRWPGLATFRISTRGKRVLERPAKNVPARSLAPLRRLALAYSSSLAGREPLHATVLTGPGGAAALLGKPGMGKSTLALVMIKQGWRLLTDDALRYQPTQRGLRPVLTPPLLKIRPRRVGRARGFPELPPLRPRGHLHYDPRYGKLTVPLHRPPSALCRSIHAFIRLHRTPSGPIRHRRLSPSESTLVLAASMFNGAIRPRIVRIRQFQEAARLASRVPVWELRYPTGEKSLHRLPAIVRAMVQESKGPIPK